MAGSAIRPSCVAVSKCNGRVIVVVRDDDGLTTTVKSSCVTVVDLRSGFFVVRYEEEDVGNTDESTGERWSYSSRRRNADTMVCFARSTSDNPCLGPTTSDEGSVLT